MSIDWKSLREKTSEFTSLDISHDNDQAKTILGITYSGLQIKLSELTAQLPVNSGATLAIWVDTLIVDYPTFDAKGTVIIARNLDISTFEGAAMPIRTPAAGETGVTELLIQQTSTGQPLHLTTTTASKDQPEYAVSMGNDPLQAFYFIVNSDGKITSSSKSDAADIQDLIGRPWALNSFKASFTAASYLMESTDPKDISTAKSMLDWVVSCLRVLNQNGNPVNSEFSELYSQAAALLVTLNVKGSAYYVPVLSSDFYQVQAGKLIDALTTYEDNLNTLTVRQDIQQAISDVSTTLNNVAQIESSPLDVNLQNISANIKDLASSIQKLRLQFDIAFIESGTKFSLMHAKIEDAQVQQFLVAYFKTAISVVKAGVNVAQIAGGDAAQGGALLSNLADSAQNGYDAIKAISAEFPEYSLRDEAKTLIAVQQQMMTSFYTSQILWAQANVVETSNSDSKVNKQISVPW